MDSHPQSDTQTCIGCNKVSFAMLSYGALSHSAVHALITQVQMHERSAVFPAFETIPPTDHE